MFQALSTIPLISQISYTGSEGLFFSYYLDNNQTLALYSNSSSSSKSNGQNLPSRDSKWYTQPVDRDTGNLYGEAIETTPLLINSTWFQHSLKSRNGYASIGHGWNKARSPMIINSAGVNGNGVVALGFPAATVTSFFTGMDHFGGILSIVTMGGKVLVEGFPNTRVVVADDSVFFRPTMSNGDGIRGVGYASCLPESDKRLNVLSVGKMDYNVFCSPIDILGVKSVRFLSYFSTLTHCFLGFGRVVSWAEI